MLRGGALLDDATAGETVGMVASLHRTPTAVGEALRRAGVEELAGRRRDKLSGGQKQRVRFAVALVSDPGLLVLDEPTAAMDVRSRRDFWKSMHGFANPSTRPSRRETNESSPAEATHERPPGHPVRPERLS